MQQLLGKSIADQAFKSMVTSLNPTIEKRADGEPDVYRFFNEGFDVITICADIASIQFYEQGIDWTDDANLRNKQGGHRRVHEREPAEVSGLQ